MRERVAPGSAVEHALSMQVELRTPPSEWTHTPSPRLFGLDADRWAGPAISNLNTWMPQWSYERLKELG